MFIMIRNSYTGPKFWACKNVTSATITANNSSQHQFSIYFVAHPVLSEFLG